MSLARLQQIADELANAIGCPVAINDYALALIAASVQKGEVDRYRVDSIMRRQTPLEVIALLQKRSLMRRTLPFVLPAGALPDMSERMCVPLVENGMPIAFLWIMIGSEKLASAALRTIHYAAAAILAELQSSRRSEQDDLLSSSHQLQRVLDADPVAGGYALAGLVAENRLDEMQRTTVAVFEVVDENGDAPVEAQAIFTLIHVAASGTWARRALFGIFEGALVLLLSSRKTDAALRAARKEIPSQLPAGYTLAAIGLSERDATRRDLRVAFDEARYAAAVARASSALGRVARFAELGPYIALRGLPLTEESVQQISSGAAELRRRGSAADVATVLTYLNHAGDAQATCAALTIHRATMYYRLEKVRDILDGALETGIARSALHLALLLGEQIDALAPRKEHCLPSPQMDRGEESGKKPRCDRRGQLSQHRSG